MRTKSEQTDALTHLCVALAVCAGLSAFMSVVLDYPAFPLYGILNFVAAALCAGLGYYIFRSLVWTVALAVGLRVTPFAAQILA